MKLTTDELEQILSRKIDPVATHLAIHNKHVFAERLHRRVHNVEDLREILALRQEIERLKLEQSEVATRAIDNFLFLILSCREMGLSQGDIDAIGLMANQLRKREND